MGHIARTPQRLEGRSQGGKKGLQLEAVAWRAQKLLAIVNCLISLIVRLIEDCHVGVMKMTGSDLTL